MKRNPSLHSLEVKDPSPFRSSELDTTTINTDPLYTGWVNDTFNREFSHLSSNKTCKASSKVSSTITQRCLVYFSRLSTYKSCQNFGSDSIIVFWSDITSFTEDADSSVCSIITEQFTKYFSNNSILKPQIDTDFEPIRRIFSGGRMRQPNHRVLFHYSGFSTSPENKGMLEFNSKFRDEKITMPQLFETIGNCCTLVVDDNYSGSLFEPIKEYSEKIGPNADIVAFLSCGKDEIMPVPKNFPADIFTSCMSTPGRMALIFHSRNYYCFSDGALKPLQPLFLSNVCDEEENRIESILTEVRYVLVCVVEAMAFRVMPKNLFDKLFRSDKCLERFACNFILACRILSSFNITPVSYPALPDMTHEPEWSTFDLRLDAALAQIQGNAKASELSFNRFLEGACKSISYVLTAPILSPYPPPELAFLNIVIRNKSLAAQACDALAVFLNNSVKAIEWCLHFDIFNAVYCVLERCRDTVFPSVLFCIIKMLAYCSDLRDGIPQTILANSIEYVLIPLLHSNEQLIEKRLALITLVLLLHDSPQCCRQAFRTHELLKVVFVSELPCWSLHLINCIAGNINDSNANDILERLISLESESIEVQMCTVSALGSFIQGESNDIMCNTMLRRKNTTFSDYRSHGNKEKRIIKRVLEYASNSSYLVRREVLIVFSKFVSTHKEKFLESNKSIYTELKVFFAHCLMDPSPSIRDMANSIERGLKNDTDIVFKSNVVDFYLASLLDNISQLLADSEVNYSKVLTQVIGEVPEIVITRTVSRNRISQESDMNRMKISSTVRYPSAITSNIILEPKYYIFGDENGNVTKASFDEYIKPITINIANEEISCINYQENFGYPVLFTSTYTGKVYSHLISKDLNTRDFDLKFTNAFQLHCDDQAALTHNYQLDVNPWTMHLYSYYKYGKSFEERDLRTGKVVREITPPEGPAVCFKSIPKYSDIIAFAGESLCIYDLRDSGKNPVITRELDSPIFDFDIVNDDIPSFSICSDKTSVGLMDSRYPTGMRTMKLWASDPASEETVCFGTNRKLALAAIGFNNGITCVNLVNGQQRSVPNISYSFASSRPPAPSKISSIDQRIVFANERREIVTVNF